MIVNKYKIINKIASVDENNLITDKKTLAKTFNDCFLRMLLVVLALTMRVMFQMKIKVATVLMN